jgi:hypothetical protein
LPNLPFGTHGSNQTHVPRRRDPPPYGFGAGTPTGPAQADGSVASGYGNGISRENGGGGPAVAAVALLGGGGGALGGLHAVNGLDPESGVALPSRRSFDERSLFERRNGDRVSNPAAQSLGPSLLGGMSNLGLRAPRGRHSIDVAGVSSKYGWDANAGANAGAEPEIISSRVDRDPPPSREAISALLRGGVGAEAPATAGERRPGAAAVAGSKPGGGDKKNARSRSRSGRAAAHGTPELVFPAPRHDRGRARGRDLLGGVTRPDTSLAFTTTVACIFAVTRTHANPYHLSSA